MDKVKINFKEREWKFIEKWGIKVKPYISLVDQMAMIEVYMEALFSDTGDSASRYMSAENGLVANILELNTNIQLLDGETVLVSMDDIFENFEMYTAIENAIVNIGDFKRRLLKSVEAKREEMRIETSLGFVLDDLYTKGTAYLSKIIETEITPESMEQLKATLKEVNASPILNILSEKLK